MNPKPYYKHEKHKYQKTTAINLVHEMLKDIEGLIEVSREYQDGKKMELAYLKQTIALELAFRAQTILETMSEDLQ
jgi:ABC-type Mn2+/Zn2+ transport system ATPase subunit